MSETLSIKTRPADRAGKAAVAAIYPYHDADDSKQFEVVRLESKDFRRRKSETEWAVKGCPVLAVREPKDHLENTGSRRRRYDGGGTGLVLGADDKLRHAVVAKLDLLRQIDDRRAKACRDQRSREASSKRTLPCTGDQARSSRSTPSIRAL